MLVYLGFLNAKEMVSEEEMVSKKDTYFIDEDHWKRILKNYAKDVVDNSCWEQRIDVGGTPFLPLIRSCEQPLH